MRIKVLTECCLCVTGEFTGMPTFIARPHISVVAAHNFYLIISFHASSPVTVNVLHHDSFSDYRILKFLRIVPFIIEKLSFEMIYLLYIKNIEIPQFEKNRD